MTAPDATAIADQLLEEIALLVPQYLEDPVDLQMSQGNAAATVLTPAGVLRGRIFGDDKGRSRWVFGIASRKVMQVWGTGYATGRFEELVYSGKLDEGRFGLNRPDFIGWLGGVPLLLDDGSVLAAAFSGFRGEKDVEIVERAALKLGLGIKRD